MSATLPITRAFSKWTCGQVADWIRSLDPKFGAYATAFNKAGVDGPILMHHLTPEVLSKLISIDADRMSIRIAINVLKSSLHPTDSDSKSTPAAIATTTPGPVIIGAVGTAAISVSGPLTDSQSHEWMKHHERVVTAVTGKNFDPAKTMIGESVLVCASQYSRCFRLLFR